MRTILALLLSLLVTPVCAGEIRLIVPAAAGGSYDHIARVVARHLGRHLPGHPFVVVDNRPTASGRPVAEWLYTTAPRDGSVIAMMHQQMPLWQVLGSERVRYDVSKFAWIGALAIDEVLAVHQNAGIKTIEEARLRPVTLGASNKLNSAYTYPTLANAFLGTKFSIVTGYGGFSQIKLAIERSEVDGLGSYPWSSWEAERPDWVGGGKIIPLLQLGSYQHKGLESVPRMIDLAPDHETRAALEVMTITADLSRTFTAPPDTPPDVLAVYRAAFAAMVRDPAIAQDAGRANFKINPVFSDQMAALMGQLSKVPPNVAGRLKLALQQ